MNEQLSLEVAKVKKVGSIFRILFLFGAVFVVGVLVFLLFLLGSHNPNASYTLGGLTISDAGLTGEQRFVIGLVFFVHFSLVALICVKFSRLFSCFEQGKIYTEETVGFLGKIGKFLLALGILSLASTGIAASMVENVSVNLNFTALFVGVLVLLLSWIFEVGRKLQVENALTI